MNLLEPAKTLTFLFTDIEGSTSLWEQDSARMRVVLSCHDTLARQTVEGCSGSIVKMTGDGMHAVFANPADAMRAAVDFQLALADPERTGGMALRVRCGLHAGMVEQRDNDYFGNSVNRAARIMDAAHGGQIIASKAIVDLVGNELPRDVLVRELGSVRLRGLADREHVYQILHTALRRDFPALRGLESTPNNLPQQTTSFVGRERDLVQLEQLLGKTRLLTLLGLGGLGKTRLSLRLAGEVMDDYPDGVWFVELAAIADPGRVPQAVATALGVKEEPGRTLGEALRNAVRDRQLLLVLDNCEHLLHACAALVNELLASGPYVKILASSREPLHVPGETSYPMLPLAVPQSDKRPSAESFRQFEAVQLFVERAVAAQPRFTLDDRNAAPIAEICRQLDGIPFALELAAARLRALSVENLAERLTDRLHLLTGGDRTALPRQQTLRALMDWSYDLLTNDERILLRRLAVFAGGWTLEAAEAVAAAGEITQSAVLELLVHLVEKSLVLMEAERDRYTMLGTVREYAQERLAQSGDAEDTRTRHLQFYLALAEKVRPELVGPEQGRWLRLLDFEQENIMAAHAWAAFAWGGPVLGLKLVSAVRRYWIIRGLLGLGYRMTLEALTRPGTGNRDLDRCNALFDLGQIGCWMGRYAEARGYLEECLSIARELGNTSMVARILQPLGMASLGQDDADAAYRYYEEALALARQQGNRRELAGALNSLAQLHRVQGAFDSAQPLYEDVLTLARELGDRESFAIALLNLAMLAVARANGEQARKLLLEALSIAQEVGSKPVGLSVLEVAAGLGALTEAWASTARFFGSAEEETARTGLHRDPADEAFLAPRVAKAREALGEEAFTALAGGGRLLSYEEAIPEVRAWLEQA